MNMSHVKLWFSRVKGKKARQDLKTEGWILNAVKSHRKKNDLMLPRDRSGQDALLQHVLGQIQNQSTPVGFIPGYHNQHYFHIYMHSYVMVFLFKSNSLMSKTAHEIIFSHVNLHFNAWRENITCKLGIFTMDGLFPHINESFSILLFYFLMFTRDFVA